MKFKIVADDFGISVERNRGIIETIEKGIVTHISLMVNCGDNSINAIDLFKKLGYNKKIIGLHLNLTEGKSLYDKKILYSKQGIYDLFLNKKVKNSDKHRIKREIKCQIEWFIDRLGFVPSFINGHQHIQTIPIIADILIPIIKQYKIDYMRIPHELEIELEKGLEGWVSQELCKVCSTINNNSIEYKKIYQDNDIQTNDYFIGLTFCNRLYTLEDMVNYIEYLIKINLDNSNKNRTHETICEIMVHPGYREIENKGWDNFSESIDREKELDILCNNSLIKLGKRLN